MEISESESPGRIEPRSAARLGTGDRINEEADVLQQLDNGHRDQGGERESACGLWAGAVEDRAQAYQGAEEPWVQSGTQCWAWGRPRQRERLCDEPAGFFIAHGTVAGGRGIPAVAGAFRPARYVLQRSEVYIQPLAP